MKKLLTTLLALCLLAGPVFGLDPAAAAPIRFGTTQRVYGIDATYAVQTAGVADVTVTFAGTVYGESYYADGVLNIAIASATPLDLSEPLATATAVLEDDTAVAPELELTGLWFNGKRATENLLPGDVTATAAGEEVAVSVEAHSDFTDKTYTLMVAAYEDSGRFLCLRQAELLFEEKDETISVTLPVSPTADHVKVFFLTPDNLPVTPPRCVQVK